MIPGQSGAGIIYEKSLHLARNYASIFVREHYLLREENSFPREFSRLSWEIFSHVVRLDQSCASENIKYKFQTLIIVTGCPEEARYLDGLHNKD